jgi:hypothetical protein
MAVVMMMTGWLVVTILLRDNRWLVWCDNEWMDGWMFPVL